MCLKFSIKIQKKISFNNWYMVSESPKNEKAELLFEIIWPQQK